MSNILQDGILFFFNSKDGSFQFPFIDPKGNILGRLSGSVGIMPVDKQSIILSLQFMTLDEVTATTFEPSWIMDSMVMALAPGIKNGLEVFMDGKVLVLCTNDKTKEMVADNSVFEQNVCPDLWAVSLDCVRKHVAKLGEYYSDTTLKMVFVATTPDQNTSPSDSVTLH